MELCQVTVVDAAASAAHCQVPTNVHASMESGRSSTLAPLRFLEANTLQKTYIYIYIYLRKQPWRAAPHLGNIGNI